MKTAIKNKVYTYEDYLKTPDDMRYELIEGDLIMIPSPETRHQRIAGRLFVNIFTYVKEHNSGEVFISPFDVYLDNENVVQPDILFVLKERINIIGEKNVQGAPDIIIEILSEGNAYRDTIQKKKLYARFGVKEYWIIAPEDEMVEIYQLKNKGEYQLYKTYIKKGVIESFILSGLHIDLNEIFG
jgi:Uma2 family endonuclease